MLTFEPGVVGLQVRSGPGVLDVEVDPQVGWLVVVNDRVEAQAVAVGGHLGDEGHELRCERCLALGQGVRDRNESRELVEAEAAPLVSSGRGLGEHGVGQLLRDVAVERVKGGDLVAVASV